MKASTFLGLPILPRGSGDYDRHHGVYIDGCGRRWYILVTRNGSLVRQLAGGGVYS